MESLLPHAGYQTTGGLDAERLQYARYRAFNEQFYVPLAKLVTWDQDQLQSSRDIRRLYSQAAGIAQFLMHYDHGRHQPALVKYLQSIYGGSDQRETLSELTGQDYTELDRQYREFLNVSDQDLAHFQRRRTKLCLGHTAVTDQGLQQLNGWKHLRWLDLSFTTTGDRGLAAFARSQSLDQLNLERTRVSDQGLQTIAGFPLLEELDLSGTKIGDEGLRWLTGLSGLKILWLSDTAVTDRGLSALAKLKNLEQLETDGTAVTPVGLNRLKEQLPKLK
jgi:hypothetical protein